MNEQPHDFFRLFYVGSYFLYVNIYLTMLCYSFLSSFSVGSLLYKRETFSPLDREGDSPLSMYKEENHSLLFIVNYALRSLYIYIYMYICIYIYIDRRETLSPRYREGVSLLGEKQRRDTLSY